MHDEDTCCVDGCAQPPHVRVSVKYPHLSGACKRHYEAEASYRPAERPPVRECLWCRSEFQPSRANHRCCSDGCSTSFGIYGRARLAEVRECAACGESFTIKRQDHRCCSKRCAQRLREYPPRVCVGCGEKFWRKGRAEHCGSCVDARRSEAAARRAAREARWEAARLIRPVFVRGRRQPAPRLFVMGFCSECGGGFVCNGRHMGPQRSGWRVFCSDVCCKRASRRDNAHRRRAAREGKRVSRSRILGRDGYRCRLCGDPLDMGASVPDPMAPVLDHIVPLALGGEHAEYNVQAAHFMCNSQKRDLLDGQVAMPV